jgi:hypothetical protein
LGGGFACPKFFAGRLSRVRRIRFPLELRAPLPRQRSATSGLPLHIFRFGSRHLLNRRQLIRSMVTVANQLPKPPTEPYDPHHEPWFATRESKFPRTLRTDIGWFL